MTREIFYADAINEALCQEMERDDRVYIYGEDIGEYGGVFGVTMGIVDKFGEERVRSTPLSEMAILGEAVGSALKGLRPVPEIQFFDFITVAMSQVVDLMANYHYRNQAALPITIRIPSAGMLSIGNFHSNCWENWFTHVPGLKVVVPSSAHDAKGLLIAAIRDPNPVLYLEQKRLYRLQKDHVPEELYEVEIGKANVVREGTDISLFTYGNMVREAKQACEKLAEDGISVELVDLRSLQPLDKEAILKSFRKTNRAIILHEAKKFSGFGGEISAILSEEAFDEMAAPIIRIGSKHMPIPMNPDLEKSYLPNMNEVIESAHQLMNY
jgi:pyruvate/2-oxoglutarate/acetoin dehydrogenase E1 component